MERNRGRNISKGRWNLGALTLNSLLKVVVIARYGEFVSGTTSYKPFNPIVIDPNYANNPVVSSSNGEKVMHLMLILSFVNIGGLMMIIINLQHLVRSKFDD